MAPTDEAPTLNMRQKWYYGNSNFFGSCYMHNRKNCGPGFFRELWLARCGGLVFGVFDLFSILFLLSWDRRYANQRLFSGSACIGIADDARNQTF